MHVPRYCQKTRHFPSLARRRQALTRLLSCTHFRPISLHLPDPALMQHIMCAFCLKPFICCLDGRWKSFEGNVTFFLSSFFFITFQLTFSGFLRFWLVNTKQGSMLVQLQGPGLSLVLEFYLLIFMFFGVLPPPMNISVSRLAMLTCPSVEVNVRWFDVSSNVYS